MMDGLSDGDCDLCGSVIGLPFRLPAGVGESDDFGVLINGYGVQGFRRGRHRKLVIGRNNWQWFGSARGTKAAVILMTLVQSCREHGINPLLYLRDVLREIATFPASKVDELTPTGWRKRQHAAVEAQRSRDVIENVVRDLVFGA